MSRLVPAKEAARIVGLPYSSLRLATQQGRIPVVRVSRAWYFERGDLEKFIEAHKEVLA
jgi:excisionase family DNA binding protein